MKRRAVSLLTRLSTLLLGVVVLLWIRSVDFCDFLAVVYDAAPTRPGYAGLREGAVVVGSSGGQFLIAVVRGESAPILAVSGENVGGRRVEFWSEYYSQLHRFTSGTEPNRFARTLGPVHEEMSMGDISAPHATVDGIVAPHWAVGAALALAPGAAVVKQVARRRRRTSGRCVGCGYDLTGNASGVCPEGGEGP